MATALPIAYFSRMLVEKPWRWELVLLLGAALMLSLSGGMITLSAFETLAPKAAKADDGFVRFLVGAASFHGVALGLVHLFLKAHGVTWRELLGLDLPQWRRAVRLGVVGGVLVVPLALLLNYASYQLLTLVQRTEPAQQIMVTILQKNAHWYQRVCFGLGAVMLAPFVEEALFRGILYRAVKQMGRPQLALWGSSLVFAAIHANLLTFVPLLGLALMFVLLYEYTDTLLAPIIAHALFNGVNLLLLLYAPKLQHHFGCCSP